MNTCLVLSLMGILLIHGATSMVHSLMVLATCSTELPNFPEFVLVGLVNGFQVFHYDSDSRRAVYKQDWVKKLSEEDAEFRETFQMSINYEPMLKYYFKTAIRLSNQTGGAHILQRMGGCEWDDETDEVIKGYFQDAFDGEDFMSLNWNTEKWVAAKQEAIITKKLSDEEVEAVYVKHDLAHKCVQNLKKLVRSGESILKRTALPLVSLLQKSSSAPVTCHATGFYPDRAMLFWTKDRGKLYENVDPGEILPNNDGTFQMSVDLDVSSVPSEDWDMYQCVFHLSGVKEDLLTRLDKDHIRTNEKKHTLSIVAAVLAILGVLLAAVGVVLNRKSPSEPKMKK